MASEDWENVGFGFLSRNKYFKEGGTAWPYTGKVTIEIDGRKYTDVSLSAKVKDKEDGSKFFSLSMSRKKSDAAPPAADAPQEEGGEIPF